MKFKFLTIIIFLLLSNIVYARWFVPDTPPPTVFSANGICLLTNCSMLAPIFMNNNTIYDAKFINATFIGTTSVNATDIKNPYWVNKTGDTMSGDLNMDGNDIINIGLITANDWSNVTITVSQILDLYSFVINASQISNPLWLNLSGGTMSGDLNMDNNDITNINLITANDWSNVTITESQISNLNHTKAGEPYLYDNNTKIYLNETKIVALVQLNDSDYCRGGNCSGNLNLSGFDISDVNTLLFYAANNSYFNYNQSNGTLDLWVNGQRQQSWGHSTTIYQEATFLANAFFTNIFMQSAAGNELFINTSVIVGNNLTVYEYIKGNGTFITDVCHSNGTDCNFNGSTFNITDYCHNGICGPLNITGDTYLNGTLYVNGINAINIYVLNLTAQQINTVVLMAEVANITNLTVQRMEATIILADEFVINGSITGLCMSNGTGCNYTNIQLEEINNTLNNLSIQTMIHIINTTINVTGGIGFSQTNYTFPYSAEILRVSVFPTTITNQYKFSANTSVTGDFIDLNKRTHIGEWKVAHDGSTIQNEQINFYLSNVAIDEEFRVEVRYR